MRAENHQTITIYRDRHRLLPLVGKVDHRRVRTGGGQCQDRDDRGEQQREAEPAHRDQETSRPAYPWATVRTMERVGQLGAQQRTHDRADSLPALLVRHWPALLAAAITLLAG